jgi:ABC-2 type transport system ATP-binding protein
MQRGLEIHEVTKRWPHRSRPVLEGVTAQLEQGQLARLTGSNGAGKTTLARIVAGLLTPDSGSVALDGITATAHRRGFHRQLGLVSAGDRGLYARLTVRHHLSYWARLALLARSQRATCIDDVIERFDLEEILPARVDRISMGQRQRLRLALGFLHRPSLILLDEPTTSLDQHGRALLAGAVRALLDGGGICVWISPEAEEVATGSAVNLTLADGRLTAQ